MDKILGHPLLNQIDYHSLFILFVCVCETIIKERFFLTYSSRMQLYSVVSNNNKALSEYSRNVGEASKIIVTAHRIFGSIIPYVILIVFNFILEDSKEPV